MYQHPPAPTTPFSLPQLGWCMVAHAGQLVLQPLDVVSWPQRSLVKQVSQLQMPCLKLCLWVPVYFICRCNTSSYSPIPAGGGAPFEQVMSTFITSTPLSSAATLAATAAGTCTAAATPAATVAETPAVIIACASVQTLQAAYKE